MCTVNGVSDESTIITNAVGPLRYGALQLLWLFWHTVLLCWFSLSTLVVFSTMLGCRQIDTALYNKMQSSHH